MSAMTPVQHRSITVGFVRKAEWRGSWEALTMSGVVYSGGHATKEDAAREVIRRATQHRAVMESMRAYPW